MSLRYDSAIKYLKNMLSTSRSISWILKMVSKRKTTEKVSGNWRSASELKHSVAGILSRSSSKSARNEHDKSETLENSDVLAIMFRISSTFGVENAKLWLERPTSALNGEAPQSVILTEAGRGRILRLLDQIDQGFAA